MDRSWMLVLLGVFWPSVCLIATAEEPAAEVEFFEKQVRPVLATHCYDCHSQDNAESGLRVDTLQGLIVGGERGMAIVPGNPDESLLISAINHGEILQMPPKAKLSPQEIANLAEWIKRGAIWPGESAERAQAAASRPQGASVSETDRQFWAFQPPRSPVPPAVQDEGWVQTPLDRFVLTALEARGLKPAPRADKRTLVRRITFDLTGLPPTSEEIERFVADESPLAVQMLVDRLLQSPRYGERWGRHWLDIARYADSNGMDENLAFEHAHRYRDYVIRAFNDDKPYDQFILEQLAGDLLPAVAGETLEQQQSRLIATGFLSIGPKMLADDDPQKKEMDIIDEQVDTLGKAFLGMTLGCARCHDHKFDPIPAADYYALAGILKSTKTMENFRVVAEWHEHSLETDEQRQQREAIEKQIEELDKQIAERKKWEPEAESTKQDVARLEAEKKQLESQRRKAPRAMGVREGAPQNLKIHLRGSHTTLGAETPRGYLQVVALPDVSPPTGSQSGRLELAQWLVHPEHPLTSRVMVNRIWRWHFGKGIVPSVDNFGRLGEPPTNQALLDWLAVEFIRSGWSIKAMHRLILTSSTYQMSTRYDEAAAALDPENKLLWRFDRRRLEAEEVRDAILAVGGRLDLTMGGSLLPFANREYVTKRDKMVASYQSNRRSVYLPVYRSAVYDVLQTFDFADPSTLEGSRPTTTVTPQALFMMNSGIVADSAAALAEELVTIENPTEAGRLNAAFRRVLGREPASGEAETFLATLGQLRADYVAAGDEEGQAQKKAWRSLCRVLIGSTEFLYVE